MKARTNVKIGGDFATGAWSGLYSIGTTNPTPFAACLQTGNKVNCVRVRNGEMISPASFEVNGLEGTTASGDTVNIDGKGIQFGGGARWNRLG